MPNNSKINIDRLLRLTEQGPYQRKKNSSYVPGVQNMSYESMLAGNHVQQPIQNPSVNGVNTASGRNINNLGRYSTLLRSNSAVSVDNSSVEKGNGEESGTATSSFKTDTQTGYTDKLNELEKLANEQYDSTVDYAEKSKTSAYEAAEDAHRIAMRDAQANYKVNDPRYGVTAENMLSQGLTGGGYGEYLAGKREEQLSAERMSANSQLNAAKQLADSNYDTIVQNAQSNKYSTQMGIGEKRADYASQLEQEFKSVYSEVIDAVNSGVYSYNLGKQILEQFKGGTLDNGILNALKAAEEEAIRSNNASVISTYLDAVHSYGAKPTAAGFREYLKTNGKNLTETQIDNLLSAYFTDGKLNVDKATTDKTTSDNGGGLTGNTGNTVVGGESNDVQYKYSTSENDILSKFKELFGREATQEEIEKALEKVTVKDGSWYWNEETTLQDLFGLAPNAPGEGYNYITLPGLLEAFKDEKGGKEPTESQWETAKKNMYFDGNYFYFKDKATIDEMFELGDYDPYTVWYQSFSSMKNENDISSFNALIADVEKTYSGVAKEKILGIANGIVISSGRFNNNGAFRQNYSDGDNFSVTINGSKFRIESQGMASQEVRDAAAAAGVKEGVVFAYSSELYLMGANGNAYKIGPRKMLYNGHYDMLWLEVFDEAYKNLKDGGTVTNNGTSIGDKNGVSTGEDIEREEGTLGGESETEKENNTANTGEPLVTAAYFNDDGSKIRSSKVGDNFSIDMGGKTYRVQNEGIVKDQALIDTLDGSGAKEGGVVRYGGDIFLKGAYCWYKIGARDLFFSGSYEKLWNAIYEDESDGQIDSVNAVSMGKYEKGLGEDSTGRGYGWAAKINNGAKDGKGWIKVNVNGSKYNVRIDGEVTDTAVTKYAEDAGVSEMEVFLHLGQAYLKMDGKIYEVNNRFLGGYNQMVKAIKGNMGDQIGENEQYKDRVVDTYAEARNFKDDLKHNSNVTIVIGSERYNLDVDAVLNSQTVPYQKGKEAGIEIGKVFAYGEDIYIMGANSVYKLGARDFFYNGQYSKLVDAMSDAIYSAEYGTNELSERFETAVKKEGAMKEVAGFPVYSEGGKQISIPKNKVVEMDKEENPSLFKAFEGKEDGVYTYKGNVYWAKGGKVFQINNNELWSHLFVHSDDLKTYGSYGNYVKEVKKNDELDSGEGTNNGTGSTGGTGGGNGGFNDSAGTGLGPIQGMGGGNGDQTQGSGTGENNDLNNNNSNIGGGGDKILNGIELNRITATFKDEANKIFTSRAVKNQDGSFTVNTSEGKKTYQIEATIDENATNAYEATMYKAVLNKVSDVVGKQFAPFYMENEKGHNGGVYIIVPKDSQTPGTGYVLYRLAEVGGSGTAEDSEQADASGQKQSGWAKFAQWFKDTFGKKESTFEDVDQGDVVRGNANFETDGKLFGIDRGMAKGDNFTVEIDGQSYAVESRGLIEESKATNLYKDAAAVHNGEIFLYGDGMYLKRGGKIYQVDARKLFLSGQAEKLKNAIKGNQEAVSDENAPVDIKIKVNDAESFDSSKYRAFNRITLSDVSGENYDLQVRAVLGTDSAQYKAGKTNGVENGQLFKHGQDFYIMGENSVLKMSAVGGKNNGDYDLLSKLDESTLDTTIIHKDYGIVNPGVVRSNELITFYIGETEYKVKTKEKAGSNISDNTNDISQNTLFYMKNALYYKDGHGQIWTLTANDQALEAFKSAEDLSEDGKANLWTEDVSQYNGTYRHKDGNKTISEDLNGTNDFKNGDMVYLQINGALYTAKRSYTTQGNAYLSAKKSGAQAYTLFVYNDSVYVYLGNCAMKLVDAGDGNVNGYDKLVESIKRGQGGNSGLITASYSYTGSLG